MRKLALFIAAGSLWLFLAALPALADGGVHIAGNNSGVNTLTADSCAGCHRAHTAQTSYLLKTSTEEALCLSCHGDGTVLATTNVLNGVQYKFNTTASPRGVAELGALRAGGFETARIGAPNRVARSGFQASYGWTISQVGKVSVSATDHTLTSSHMPGLSANLSTGVATTRAHVAWGSGVAGSGNGASFTLECTSCHNPHGNGAYAILNVGPMKTDAGATVAYQLSGVSVDAAGVFTAAAATGFSNGDKVTVAEAATPSTVLYSGSVSIPVNYPDHGNTVANPYQFTIGGVTSASVSSTLIVTRSSGVKVDDWNTADTNGTRNYTVIQLGGNTSVLASSVETYGSTAGDYFRRYVPWNAPNPTATQLSDQPNGRSTAIGQLNNWCAQCHTRYLTNTHSDTRASDTPVAGSSTGFMFQHKTNGTGSSPSCNLCHVSHGSNVSMIGQAANVPFPNTQLYTNADSSTDSRLLKIDNRGTCQQCHEPTGTAQGGAFSPASIGTLVGNITSIALDGTVTLAGGATVANDDYIVIQNTDATRTLSGGSWSFSGAYFVINSSGSTFKVATTKGGAPVPALTAGTAVGTVSKITLSVP